jgi:hypothetical protein
LRAGDSDGQDVALMLASHFNGINEWELSVASAIANVHVFNISGLVQNRINVGLTEAMKIE